MKCFQTARITRWLKTGLLLGLCFKLAENTSAQSLTWLGKLQGAAGPFCLPAPSDSSDGGGPFRIPWEPEAQWPSSNNMPNLSMLDNAASYASVISADGQVVAGWAQDASGRRRAFRWTAESGLQDLGTLGGDQSEALAISADGRVVVGWAQAPDGNRRAFRWTAETGLQDLGSLGGNWSYATAVSADGNVVVGYVRDFNGNWHAFRWTSQTGMQNLGAPGKLASSAAVVSADGSIIIGWIEDANRNRSAFQWTLRTGFQNLNTRYARLLADGSRLLEAVALSLDGRYITGYGYNAQTQCLEAFLLDTQPQLTNTHPLSTSPAFVRLQAGYPNPFHAQFTIPFMLFEAAYVTLHIYDVLGRHLATLLEGPQPPGWHQVPWDGTDAAGQPLPNGLYLYQLEARSLINGTLRFKQTRRVFLLR